MKFLKAFALFALVLSTAAVAPKALAYFPTLSATYQSGSSGNVQMTVSNSDRFAQISLYSRQSSSLWTVVTNIGQTDGSGYFTQVVSMPSDGSNSPLQMYVLVNGQQSSTISVYPNNNNGGCGYYGCSGCTYNCNNVALSLSPSTVNLSVGQSSVVTASFLTTQYNSVSLYVSSNTNSSVATASINSNQLTVYGNSQGSTTISVCANNQSSSCASLYVTVSGGSSCGYYGCGSNLSLSQTSASLSVGQNSSITASNVPSVYISSNSNPSVVSASANLNQINLQALTSGSCSIYICGSNTSQCATVYVTVTGGSGYGSIYFSPSSLSLTAGQNSTVSIYNNNGSYSTYYISSNSNPNVASASVSGSSLYVNALTSGSTSISVCQSSYGSSCATLYVTVTGSVLGATNYPVSIRDNYFSPQTITIPSGSSITWRNDGSMNHTVTFDSSPYTNSGTIYLGSSYTQVFNTPGTYYYHCNFHSGMTGTIVVTSSGSGNGNVWFSPSSPNMYVGQSLAVSINSSAYTASNPYSSSVYYVSSNSNPGVATASVSGTVLNLYAYQNGSTNINVCSSALGFCGTLYVTVGGGSSGSGNLSLSQSSLSLSPGQSSTVNIYGNGSYYVSSNSSNYVATANISANVLNVYASQNGNTTISICQSNYSGCANVYVTVSGYSYGTGGGLQYPGGGNVLGASAYANGQLISEGSTIYIVYKNLKTPFANPSAFTGLGFKYSNVLSVGSSNLNYSGYTVASPNVQHPWGSWIKSGNTVYFVSETGLIPLPDWNTFLNNGGQSNFIVPANSYDFRLPMQAAMTYNDSRLR